jgi:hypothetical protein
VADEDLHDDLMVEELGVDSSSPRSSTLDEFVIGAQQEPVAQLPPVDFNTDDVESALLSGGGEDLQPGGAATTAPPAATATSMLEGMTLKELRRLAEQKGVTGAKHLKKHELIEAIRGSKTAVTPFEMSADGVLSLE